MSHLSIRNRRLLIACAFLGIQGIFAFWWLMAVSHGPHVDCSALLGEPRINCLRIYRNGQSSLEAVPGLAIIISWLLVDIVVSGAYRTLLRRPVNK